MDALARRSAWKEIALWLTGLKQRLLFETMREGARAFHAALDEEPKNASAIERVRFALRGICVSFRAARRRNGVPREWRYLEAELRDEITAERRRYEEAGERSSARESRRAICARPRRGLGDAAVARGRQLGRHVARARARDRRARGSVHRDPRGRVRGMRRPGDCGRLAHSLTFGCQTLGCADSSPVDSQSVRVQRRRAPARCRARRTACGTETKLSTAAAEATAIARAAGDVEAIYVLGGDGTYNEVLNGVEVDVRSASCRRRTSASPRARPPRNPVRAADRSCRAERAGSGSAGERRPLRFDAGLGFDTELFRKVDELGRSPAGRRPATSPSWRSPPRRTGSVTGAEERVEIEGHGAPRSSSSRIHSLHLVQAPSRSISCPEPTRRVSRSSRWYPGRARPSSPPAPRCSREKTQKQRALRPAISTASSFVAIARSRSGSTARTRRHIKGGVPGGARRGHGAPIVHNGLVHSGDEASNARDAAPDHQRGRGTRPPRAE